MTGISLAHSMGMNFVVFIPVREPRLGLSMFSEVLRTGGDVMTDSLLSAKPVTEGEMATESDLN